jgi:hypothetical protein
MKILSFLAVLSILLLVASQFLIETPEFNEESILAASRYKLAEAASFPNKTVIKFRSPNISNGFLTTQINGAGIAKHPNVLMDNMVILRKTEFNYSGFVTTRCRFKAMNCYELKTVYMYGETIVQPRL